MFICFEVFQIFAGFINFATISVPLISLSCFDRHVISYGWMERSGAITAGLLENPIMLVGRITVLRRGVSVDTEQQLIKSCIHHR